MDLHAKPLRPIALLHVRYCLLPLQKHRLHNDISGLYHTALAQRCLRFAARVTPGPRKTRFRLGASLDRVDGAKLTSTGTQHEVSAQLMASSSSRLLLAHCNAVFGTVGLRVETSEAVAAATAPGKEAHRPCEASAEPAVRGEYHG